MSKRKQRRAPTPGAITAKPKPQPGAKSEAGVSAGRALKARTQQRRAREQRQRWLGLGAVLVVAAIAVAVFGLTRPPAAPPVPAERAAKQPSIGPENAPVTVVQFGDFQCINCVEWRRQGIPRQILQTYGDKVRFVFRAVNVISPPRSGIAAEAAQCAFDQGKFWEYHDLLYDRFPAASDDELKAYAAQLGLDRATFNACFDSHQYQALVAQDTQDAYKQGLRGVPFFTINGQPMYGFTFQEFQQRIDPLLRGR